MRYEQYYIYREKHGYPLIVLALSDQSLIQMHADFILKLSDKKRELAGEEDAHIERVTEWERHNIKQLQRELLNRMQNHGNKNT